MNAVAITAPSRPILRWHGGKWLQAPWILQHFPPHRVYVEPFGGAWSVGFRKERSYAEIWNDLDGELVNLFRVLRDTARAARLVEAISLTPFARDEFNAAYTPARGALERARRLLVRSFMGHGSDGASGSIAPASVRLRTAREPRLRMIGATIRRHWSKSSSGCRAW